MHRIDTDHIKDAFSEHGSISMEPGVDDGETFDEKHEIKKGDFSISVRIDNNRVALVYERQLFCVFA
ncbi:hypothetical protein L596_026794 [Steinernema carpocapsae]|uniref:Uncharacterized protein n=1 Tax=Steinernema carpocapsae TaxID=34508 RepID=A0A4U5M2J9_STECR|nr:hypothetical protein L596_026794 [Steinernema carpocapsae]